MTVTEEVLVEALVREIVAADARQVGEHPAEQPRVHGPSAICAASTLKSPHSTDSRRGISGEGGPERQTTIKRSSSAPSAPTHLPPGAQQLSPFLRFSVSRPRRLRDSPSSNRSTERASELARLAQSRRGSRTV